MGREGDADGAASSLRRTGESGHAQRTLARHRRSLLQSPLQSRRSQLMKKSADKRALAPVDVSQRCTIKEATSYLRISHASIYKEINARRLRVLKHGKRTFIPG